MKRHIETLTINNTNFRRVLETTKYSQLVLMSLDPLEDIGVEKHKYTSQFFKVEQGRCKVVVNNLDTRYLRAGDSITIPPNTLHNIINHDKNQTLKLYTIYSGKILHDKNLVEKEKS